MVRKTNAPPEQTETPPQSDAGPALELLQGQLREKEHLVAALTERLEQAAEQLDRLRRTGADKGHRPLSGSGGGNLPPELLQDHKSTLDELKRVIGNWEDMQAGATLGRIETQVIELRDLVSGAIQRGGGFSSGGATSRGQSAAPSVAPKSGGKDPHSWWEKQKAALLGDSPPAEEASEPAPAAEQPAASADAAGTPREDAGYSPPAMLGETVIPDAPPAVDFESITLDEAKQAIRDRDQVIEALRGPLLLLQAAGQLPRDLQGFDHLPEPLRQRIAEIETQWQAKFRQAELELSLERARVAREESQLRQQHDILQKQLKQSGHAHREQGEAASGEEGTSRRRWFRFMGKAGDEGKDPGESSG